MGCVNLLSYYARMLSWSRQDRDCWGYHSKIGNGRLHVCWAGCVCVWLFLFSFLTTGLFQLLYPKSKLFGIPSLFFLLCLWSEFLLYRRRSLFHCKVNVLCICYCHSISCLTRCAVSRVCYYHFSCADSRNFGTSL